MEKTDVCIIGQGPAGLSAAIYTSRAGLKTLILGCNPKIADDYDIDNYFGFAKTVSGKELIKRGIRQASRFGTQMVCDKVLSIHHQSDNTFLIKTENNQVNAASIILATGISRKKPQINNFEKYEGRGISYCVSCDGFFFRDKKVLVLGEGNYAANQAIELLEYTSKVSLCTMDKELTISQDYLTLLKKNNIDIIQKKIIDLAGGSILQNVIFDDKEPVKYDGIFVALGDASSLDFALTLGILTQGIFIQVDNEQKTNVPGILAAGDCVGGFLQISVAVGEGAVAARSAINYVRDNYRK